MASAEKKIVTQRSKTAWPPFPVDLKHLPLKSVLMDCVGWILDRNLRYLMMDFRCSNFSDVFPNFQTNSFCEF